MSERIAVCPGSFDPVTLGHLNIFRRTADIFDRVIVLVMQNAQKRALFTPEQRRDIILASLNGAPGISVVCSSGICADAARELGACAIVKGVRSSADFDYETDIAAVNRGLGAPETVFIPSNPIYRHVSTSTALHLYRLGTDVTSYFPSAAIDALNRLESASSR